MKFEVHTNDKMQLKEALSTKQDKTFALGELEKIGKMSKKIVNMTCFIMLCII